MAKSEIIITQSPHGSSSAGKALRGLDLYTVGSQAIVFTNSTAGNKNVTKWEWILLERPPGSAAILSGSDTREASIQADVAGRYVVSLRVNDLGNGTPGYSVTVAGVSYPVYDSSGGTDYGDWDLPAFNEGVDANWADRYGADNPYGAQRELYRMFSDVRERYLVNIETRDPKVLKFFFTPDSRIQYTNSTTLQIACYTMPIRMADYNYGTIKFGALLHRTGAADTARAYLYNGANQITGSGVTTTAGPETVLSSALTVGTGPGDIRLTTTVYNVRIEVVTGGGSSYCGIYDAFLDLDA